MAIYYGNDVFFIAANTTLGFQWRFGNEAYEGPIIVCPAPTALDQAINGSLGAVRFTARNPDGFTSRCFYHHTVTNGNNFGVLFKLHAASGLN